MNLTSPIVIRHFGSFFSGLLGRENVLVQLLFSLGFIIFKPKMFFDRPTFAKDIVDFDVGYVKLS